MPCWREKNSWHVSFSNPPTPTTVPWLSDLTVWQPLAGWRFLLGELGASTLRRISWMCARLKINKMFVFKHKPKGKWSKEMLVWVTVSVSYSVGVDSLKKTCSLPVKMFFLVDAEVWWTLWNSCMVSIPAAWWLAVLKWALSSKFRV